jgi:hypothetical protein
VNPIEVEGSNLSTGVGAGVRTPCKVDCLSLPAQLSQGLLEFALCGAGIRLSLAAHEVGSVVSKGNLVTSHIRDEGLDKQNLV